jgi:dihydrofolate reductase
VLLQKELLNNKSENIMRKIVVISMITLDGVMQAPGGPEEDPSNGFTYGGWTVSYLDEAYAKDMKKDMQPSDYLLGRKTFQIFAGYWPQHATQWPAINEGTKYVMSQTMENSDWKNTVFIKTLADIKKLKNSNGPDIQVWGSTRLIQLLLKNDLVDELRLKIYPLTLGNGQRLFQDGTMPAAFTLIESPVTPSGVIMANYSRAGKVTTGTVGD